MKVLLWFAGLVALFGLIVGVELYRFNLNSAQAPTTSAPHVVLIDGVAVRVDLAETPAQQERGLSGRAGLASDEGMLFVFPRDGQYQFWMKDMKFSIDIIWLDSNGRVVYVVPNLAPSTYPNGYGSTQPSRYVLEVKAGFAAEHGVKVGDTAAFR